MILRNDYVWKSWEIMRHQECSSHWHVIEDPNLDVYVVGTRYVYQTNNSKRTRWVTIIIAVLGRTFMQVRIVAVLRSISV